MPALHVAIDCRVISPLFPGIGRATLETIQAMIHSDAELYLSLISNDQPSSELTAVASAHTSRAQIVPVSTKLRDPRDQWALPHLLRQLQPTIFHAPYYAIPLYVPCPLVVTIYDLIPRLFPYYWPNPIVRASINAWTTYALRRASRIIATSHSTADDIERLMPAYRPKVSIVPLGVSFPPRPVQHPASTPYLLYVGSNKPHKNLPRLIAAFAQIADETLTNLIIAGAWDPRFPEAREAVNRLQLTQRVAFEHNPSNDRLNDLYVGATAFVFPSQYEGFGLPVLEAMAAGLPVATTGRGSLAEVAADAALLFNPDNEDAMADSMRRLLLDELLRAQLIAAGRSRAALFPWSRTAKETVAIYESFA